MSYYDYEDYRELEENADFNNVLNKLIEFEVEKRLGERIEIHNQTETLYKEKSKKLSDVSRELFLLKQDQEKSIKEASKEGYSQAITDRFNGYSCGDEVWFAHGKYNYYDCGKCLGEKKLTVSHEGIDIKVTCPECSGRGNDGKSEYKASKGQIKQIDMKTWNKNKNFEALFYLSEKDAEDEYNSHKAKFLFTTKEECEKFILEEYGEDRWIKS